MMIELGKRYRDVATGLSGIATQRTERYGGAVRVCLEWRSPTGIAEHWLDAERLTPDDLAPGGDYA